MLSSTFTRLLRATGLAAIVALSANSLVLAKMPQFDVEIAPAEPSAGEPIQIVVRFWPGIDHSESPLADWEPTIDDLLVIRSTGSGVSEVPVILRRIEQGRYEAEVDLATGRWTLVAFPDRSGWASPEVPAGFPDTIEFIVRELEPDLTASAIPALSVALLLLAAYSRSRLRSAALTRSSSVDCTPTSARAARDASRASASE
jgi:hypothetical protein